MAGVKLIQNLLGEVFSETRWCDFLYRFSLQPFGSYLGFRDAGVLLGLLQSWLALFVPNFDALGCSCHYCDIFCN